MKTREEIMSYIKAIKSNYPPENYTMLRKALDEAIFLLELRIPRKAVSNGISSQACPVCYTNVNWNYCKECGQRIVYG